MLYKLASINTPKVTPLSSGNCETVEDLWNKVIYPLLPQLVKGGNLRGRGDILHLTGAGA